MRFARLLKTVLVGVTTLLCVVSANAQQVRFFPDFSSVANLQLNGAHQATYNSAKVLRLTDGYTGVGNFRLETGSAWFTIQQPVNLGFTTYFKFQIDSAGLCCTPGDGFAFVIQNAANTNSNYGASGGGITARGVGNGGLGYAGIPNSLAIEFDTAVDAWDNRSANHIAVQSCGTLTNGPVHTSGMFTIGSDHNVTSCLVGSLTTGFNGTSSIPTLGVSCSASGACADGKTHEVVIEYTPPASATGSGTLSVWIDPTFISGTHNPTPTSTKAINNLPYTIVNSVTNPTGLSLASGGKAWVGFTASQTNIPQAHDILAWEFTPHTVAQVTQVIPPGGTEADYTFGGHHMGVNYFSGFVNNGCKPTDTDPTNPCQMTVVETPIARNVFYKTRLLTQTGRPFSNEQCVVYLQTGGNCIIYSVTCAYKNNPTVTVPCPSSPSTCPNADPTLCITFNTSFYTTDPITAQNADYLKTDPVGSNNWLSIFVSYDPNVLDGKTTGTGGTASDFVATFALGARP